MGKMGFPHEREGFLGEGLYNPTSRWKVEAQIPAVVCSMAGLINPFGAARSGDLTLLRLYFDRGGDPNQADSDSFTALHFACNGGHRDVVDQLIQHRAEVNARSHFQSTPLHFACEHGFVEIVRLLLANGATVDAHNSDQATPLHFASQKGHIDAVQLLVEAGAKVDARSNRGNSPLHYACFFGRYPVVRLLLMSGADIGLRNDGGTRPGEQFFGKVPRETRASLSTLLRERSLSPGSRTPVGGENCDGADDPTTVKALNSLVRHLRAEASGLRESLRERDAEVEQLKRNLALSGAETRKTGTD